jgi:hypothetical protein
MWQVSWNGRTFELRPLWKSCDGCVGRGAEPTIEWSCRILACMRTAMAFATESVRQYSRVVRTIIVLHHPTTVTWCDADFDGRITQILTRVTEAVSYGECQRQWLACLKDQRSLCPPRNNLIYMYTGDTQNFEHLIVAISNRHAWWPVGQWRRQENKRFWGVQPINDLVRIPKSDSWL